MQVFVIEPRRHDEHDGRKEEEYGTADERGWTQIILIGVYRRSSAVPTLLCIPLALLASLAVAFSSCSKG